jgi:hypothetical protein
MQYVTMTGKAGTSQDIKTRVQEFAQAAGTPDAVQKWGGMGSIAPFVSFSCTDAFSAALQGAKEKTFPDLTLSVIDPSKPQDPAHC